MVSNWKVIFAALVIFGAGAVTGALLVHRSAGWGGARHSNPGRARAMQTPSPGGMRLEFLRRAGRELNLTTEQRGRVDEILQQSQERTRAMVAPVWPQVRDEVQRAKEEVRKVLTPAQQARFDDLLKKTRAKVAREVFSSERSPSTGAPPPQAQSITNNHQVR